MEPNFVLNWTSCKLFMKMIEIEGFENPKN
jgi:hypothetical protein